MDGDQFSKGKVQDLSVTGPRDRGVLLKKHQENVPCRNHLSLEACLCEGREEAGVGPWRRGRYRVLDRRTVCEKNGRSEVWEWPKRWRKKEPMTSAGSKVPPRRTLCRAQGRSAHAGRSPGSSGLHRSWAAPELIPKHFPGCAAPWQTVPQEAPGWEQARGAEVAGCQVTPRAWIGPGWSKDKDEAAAWCPI